VSKPVRGCFTKVTERFNVLQYHNNNYYCIPGTVVLHKQQKINNLSITNPRGFFTPPLPLYGKAWRPHTRYPFTYFRQVCNVCAGHAFYPRAMTNKPTRKVNVIQKKEPPTSHLQPVFPRRRPTWRVGISSVAIFDRSHDLELQYGYAAADELYYYSYAQKTRRLSAVVFGWKRMNERQKLHNRWKFSRFLYYFSASRHNVYTLV